MLSQNSAFAAISTYITIILISLIVIFRRYINSDKIIITVSSFLFIFSGFFVQITINRHNELHNFFEEWGKVLGSPPITVLATAFGIFIGNTLLKLLSNEDNRRATSIVLVNGLEAHIRALATINLLLKADSNTDVAKIQIYLTKVRENKSYEKALTEIGRFRNEEADLLSKYESHLWNTLIDIERELNDSRISINYSKNYSKLKITAIIIYAMLCSYVLAKKHWPAQEQCQERYFFRDFPIITKWLLDTSVLECPTPIRRGFVEVLLDVRERYQSLGSSDGLRQGEILQVLYLPIRNEKELLVFGTSVDEMKKDAIAHLTAQSYESEERNQVMLKSKFEILSPWN